MCLCKHSFVFKDQMHAHKNPIKTAAIMHHSDLWSVKAADVWWKLQVLSFCWSLPDLKLMDINVTVKTKSRMGVMCCGRWFYVLNAWYIFMCTHGRFLLLTNPCTPLFFSALALLFSCFGLTQRCVRQNACCCASTRLPVSLHADFLIQKACKVELSSGGRKRPHKTARNKSFQ